MKFINVKYYQFFNGGIFMKVKKLLTLLLATSMLVACGTQTTPSSSDKSSSEPAPSTTSSDVPSTSSSSSDTSSPSTSTSSSTAPSSSSTAPSTSSTAPTPSSSSSDPSTSSSAPVVVTLVSITVTAPTKLAYTTADTELDLAGMVVTANYSDATQRVITEGYTVSPVDFSTAGDKTVTVTFEGKTDSFTITVAQAKPTAWDAVLTAKFQANLYGYVPPFFYAPDFGLGTLSWNEDTEDKALYALGGNVAAQKADEESPLKPIGDLFLADGFVASTVPNYEENEFYYIMEKAVTSEGKQRYVEARIATVNTQGSFANGGQFYIEIGDSYFYDWAESGFEAAIKAAMSFTEDIPDLPEGFRFLKRYLQVFNQQKEYGYVGFQAAGATVALVNSYLDVLDNAGWAFKRSSREDIMYDIFSPECGIRLGFGYDQTNQIMTLQFDVPPTVPEYVNYVADLYAIPGKGYVFNYSSDTDSYYYTFNEELATGQTLGDLLDKYSPALLNDTEGAFALKGTRQERDGLSYETYVSTVKNISVTIYAFSDEDGTGVQISVEKYNAVPEQFIPAINLLGINLDDVHVQAATPTASAYAYAQVRSAASVAYADALKVFTDILDADTTLGFQVIVPLNDTTMQSGEAAKHIEYANNNVRIQFLAWTTTSATIVQMVFYDYEAAPETDLIEKINDVLASLGSYNLTWDDEDRAFTYANYRTLGKGETVTSVATAMANALVNATTLDLELLVSNVSDSKEAIFVLYSDEVGVRIVYSTYYGNTPVMFITARVFDTEVDPVVNALSSILDVNLLAGEGGTFSANGQFGFSATYSLQQYGNAILQAYIAADLIACTALGFTLKSAKMDGNNFVGEFQNGEGYKVKITLLGDADKNYSNYYTVLVTVPNA